MKSSPIILQEGRYTSANLRVWIRAHKPHEINDIFELQSQELFEIRNPSLKSERTAYTRAEKAFIASRTAHPAHGDWIFFPWSGVLVHAVTKNEYAEIRTNRNRNLITTDEQRILANATIGVAGLSVGSNIATGMLYQGIGSTFRIAEFDRLETANLNRIRAGMPDIGKKKMDVLTQTMYEVDPHVHIEEYPKGLTRANLSKFVGTTRPLSILVDEIDDFEMKIRMRFAAKAARIPVLMFANVADKVILDVERYDKEPERPIFHGLLGNIPDELLRGKVLTDSEKHQYAVLFVGKENVSARALASVAEIGKTLTGRPQLSATVTISGGIATYLARKILLDEDMPSGRQVVSFASFEPT